MHEPCETNQERCGGSSVRVPGVSQVSSEEISVEKKEAEVALEAAIPALEEAAEALNDLKKDDITEIRSFAKPHVLVQKVCDSPASGQLTVACCLALASICSVHS